MTNMINRKRENSREACIYNCVAESWLPFILSRLDKLSCRAGMDHHGPQRAKRMQVFTHRQLILLINTLYQKAETNQRNHMLWWLFKQTYRPWVSHDCPSIRLETATLKHAAMQSCGIRLYLSVGTNIHSSILSEPSLPRAAASQQR